MLARTAGFLLLAMLVACAGSRVEDEIVVHGGRIFTADSAAPWAEALLIRGDRIALVGPDSAVQRAASRAATSVDLGGRVVVPGFNDSHDHIGPSAPGLTVAAVPELLPDPPWSLVSDSLRAAASRVPKGTWLHVPVGERVFSDPTARRATLDRLTSDHPVELVAWTGHGRILNSAALAAIGVGDSVPDPLGGRFERDRTGRLTGLLEEYAGYVQWSRLAPATDSAVRAVFARVAAEVVGWGITSVQDMMTGPAPETFARIIDSLNLPIRLGLMPFPFTGPGGRLLTPWREFRSGPRANVTIGGTKWILDGTPVERLAVLRAPYSDRPGWYGRLNFPPDTLRVMLKELLDSGTQPVLHAVGDSTIGLVLNLMADLAPDSAWRRLRPRIEHGDGLSPDQFDLARRLGVVVVQNPSHFGGLASIGVARLGPDRVRFSQPMKTLFEHHIPVALGSDGPRNPFLNIMLAAMHPANPAEAITVEQAVRAYTVGSSYAQHAEHEKGRLSAGMVADLAVLSADIFSIPVDQLPRTTSVLTLVGGRPVHDPNGWLGAEKAATR